VTGVPEERTDAGTAPAAGAAGPGADGAGADLLEAFVALMPDAAVVVDDAGAVVSVNEHAERLFGYPPGRLVGREIETLVPERFRHRHRGHRAEYGADARHRPMGAGLDLHGRRLDGSEFPVDISLAPVPGRGRPLVVAAIRDISERMAATAAMAELAAIVQSTSDAIVGMALDGRISSWNPGAEQVFGYTPDDVVGRHISLLVPEDASRDFEEMLDAVVTGKSGGRRDTQWLRSDGTRIDVALALSPLTDAGNRSLGFSAVVRDITDRKHAEAELRRRGRQQAAMAEIRLRLLAGAPIEEVLELICERGCDLVEGDAAAVVSNEPRQLRIAAAARGAARLLGHVLSPQASLSGRAIASGSVEVVASMADDPGTDRRFAAEAPSGPGLATPIASDEGVHGVLVVTRAAGRPEFDPEEIATARMLADQAALGIHLGRSREDRERLVLTDERERIARDLHDLVIQRLFAAGMTLEGVVRVNEDKAVSERLRHVVTDLDETIREIRSTIFALEMHEGTAHGLRAEVLHLAEEAAKTLGFRPAVRFDGPVDTAVPEGVIPHVLAVVRETLSNAARHAAATRVDVALSVGDDVVLTVADDGVGLAGRTRESGLGNLRRRAEKLGGALYVDSPAAGGARVEWRVPVGR
jgi:PAS domain S-box-containing protein